MPVGQCAHATRIGSRSKFAFRYTWSRCLHDVSWRGANICFLRSPRTHQYGTRWTLVRFYRSVFVFKCTIYHTVITLNYHKTQQRYVYVFFAWTTHRSLPCGRVDDEEEKWHPAPPHFRFTMCFKTWFSQLRCYAKRDAGMQIEVRQITD